MGRKRSKAGKTKIPRRYSKRFAEKRRAKRAMDQAQERLIDQMIRRREMLFPDADRMIVDCKLTEMPGGIYVNVASTVVRH